MNPLIPALSALQQTVWVSLSALPGHLPLLLGNAAAEAEEKAPPVIDIDGTVVVQFAIFLVLYFILKSFFFDPYLKMRADRDRGISGVRDEADAMTRRAHELGQDYQRRMQAARAQADEERARLRNQGLERERDLLAETRAVAQARVGSIRQQIAQQAKAAEQQLAAQAQPLARRVARQLLGREV